jgi:molybdopterin-containing oxidoreductase family membrane subunit
MVVCNLVIPFAILLWRRGRTPTGTLIASLSVAIGMWIERFTIVAPTLTQPSLGFEPAVYTPTMTEVAITAGSVALFALLFLLFFKIFPAISVWEVEEGEEIERVQRKAEELALQSPGVTTQVQRTSGPF